MYAPRVDSIVVYVTRETIWFLGGVRGIVNPRLGAVTYADITLWSGGGTQSHWRLAVARLHGCGLY